MAERKTGNKIVIFGGTFNPIHNGHIAIARRALEQFDPDTVLFLPTGRTAYKDFSGAEMSRHRCRMVELAIADEPRFGISFREAESEDVNYTYLTLERMREDDPDAELYFILGGDSLRDFPKWRCPERICAEAVILVAARSGADAGKEHVMCPGTEENSRHGDDNLNIRDPGSQSDLKRQMDVTNLLMEDTAIRFKGDFRRLDTPLMDISSSEIRRRLKDGLDISCMVPPAVEDYIYKNGLYYGDLPPENRCKI